MNMNKSIKNLAPLAAAGVIAILAQNAHSQNLYNNTTGNQSENFNYTGQAGNEVVLAGSASSDLITGFNFQYDVNATGVLQGGLLPNSVNVVLNLWANTGALVSGYASPGTLLYSTAPFALTTATSSSVLSYVAADFGGTGVVVPKDFTWTVSFSGLTSTESAGLGLYNPPTVGGNYADEWYNSGSPNAWTLNVAPVGNPPLEFGASITGTAVPDSSSLSLSALAVLAGFAWMKRSLRTA
jgi:hypothetical protein